MLSKNVKNILFLIFCYLVLYYISSSYMYARHDPSLLATGYDAGRYTNLKSFFEGSVSGQKTAWHLFFTYTLFITLLEKINLLNHYVEIQYVVFYISSILFYKSLINFNFSKLTSCFATGFVVCNPFLIFWIHTLNHAGLTVSLLMITFYFLSRYDHAILFKIFFFITIFLLLKIDGKVFFTVFMILFYRFILFQKNNYITNLLILSIFFILYFIYLNKFAIGLEDFSASYLQNDIRYNYFIAPNINSDVMATYEKCLITQYNSLYNHFCALIDNPLYSIKLYSARLFLLLTWINTKLSFKYNFFAFGMMIFLYFGLMINLLKTKFTKFKFFLLSTYMLTMVIILPYILRGDQKQVFYGLIFIVPLSFSGYEILFNYIKKR